ncbi:hypothetical protein R9C00_12725 [Flammeovirgaceae bacterium SG7u.111]|nr:hypothetical protein [Flammeovirgaceae bacterium SG7u.132]WPO38318.1 hypothetical protein R9C00_12725 [Flammeovirgaceae bacterium SG7u.111]
MKDFEDIDDLFFEGLEGKSIEKPASFWNELQTKILAKSMVKPWWNILNFFTVSAIALAISAVITVIILNWGKTGNDTQIQSSHTPENANILVAVDSSQSLADTLAIETASQSMPDTLEKAETKVSQEASQIELPKVVEEKPILITVPEVVKPLPSDSLIEPLEIPVDSLVIDSSEIGQIQLLDSINQPKDTLKPKKKVVSVVIIQDTLVVTDTIQLPPKK